MMSRRVNRRAFLEYAAAAPIAWGARCESDGAFRPQEGAALEACGGDETFRNWARTISCKPERYCQPASTDEVVQIVKDARDSGKRVRVVGAGHSWSPLVLTRDVLVNLDRMQELTGVDSARRTATMQAGIRLKKLTPALAEKGLGMANLGSIREQSIAGATATATHGTGLGLGIISTQIVGAKIVTGAGEVLTLQAGDEVLSAVRVSLGALGIVTEVTLQCVPDYRLEYTAYWCKFDDVLPRIEALNRENARVRLWWLVPFLGTQDGVILTTMNPPGTAPGVMESAESLPTGVGQPLEAAPLPMDAESLAATAIVAGGRPEGTRLLKFADRYEKVMGVPLAPILHRECEYAIPVQSAGDALRSLRRAVDEGGLNMKLPVEVRFVAKDDCLLSPARGRDVCYIGLSTQDNATEVFERFEPMMRRLGGRPHWGKCFSLTRQDLEAMYPDSFEKFRTIRKELDPRGVFANEMMQQLFD